MSSTDFVDRTLAGAYLVHSTTFDLTKAVSWSFDFFMPDEADFDDVAFMLGDIADGYDHTGSNGGTAGELLNVKFRASLPNRFLPLAFQL